MASTTFLRAPSVSLRCSYYLSRRCFVSLADKHFRKLSPEEISPKKDYNIAGRKWLPGSQGEGLPKYLNKAREGFPYALEALPTSNLTLSEWAKVASQVIDENLSKYGTMVLRGLPLTKNENISEFSKSLPYTRMSYPEGGLSYRSLHDVEARVYTASEEPPEFTIELHSELSYSPVYPRKLIFYCLQEPAEGCGGLTVICDSQEFVGRLDPEVIKKLDDKQIRYIYSFPHKSKSTYQSWQKSFNTDCIKEVKDSLEKGGYEYSYDEKSKTVSFWNTLPAFIPHPDTGEKTWFNSVTINHITFMKESSMYPGEDKLDTVFRSYTSYGDGSPIELDVIQHIRACMWHSTHAFQWKTGDMLIVDNMNALHGRLSFTGERTILAYLMAD